MSFRETLEADRCLLVLQLLGESGGSASEGAIERGLLLMGERLDLDRDSVRRYLRHLEKTTCVEIEMYRDTTMVATITNLGAAVMAGRKTVDGISKPPLGG